MTDPNSINGDVRQWKRYPEYSPSGVPWLGELPSHWHVRPLRYIFHIINGATPSSTAPECWDGDILWATPEDLGSLTGDTIHETRRRITPTGYKSCGTTLAPAGSLVLSTRAPIGNVAVAGGVMCTNQGCRTLSIKTEGNTRYFYYVLLTSRPEIQSLGRGSTFTELPKDSLAAVCVPVPPLTEQHQIVAFLRREMAKLDALLAGLPTSPSGQGAFTRMVKLLQEYRTALIAAAVTGRIDVRGSV